MLANLETVFIVCLYTVAVEPIALTKSYVLLDTTAASVVITILWLNFSTYSCRLKFFAVSSLTLLKVENQIEIQWMICRPRYRIQPVIPCAALTPDTKSIKTICLFDGS